MILTGYEDEVEFLGDDVIRISPLQELSNDLLTESIKLQIDDLFTSRTNFLVEFQDCYINDLDGYDNPSVDLILENDGIAKDFYLGVLKQISDKFNLEIDFDSISELNISSIRNLTEGIYEFFILKYKKNVTKFMIKILNENCDVIADGIKLDEEDICVISYKEKLKTESQAILLSHLNSAIKTIIDFDLDPLSFMDYFNQDKFEVAIVKYAIDNSLLNGYFVNTFLKYIFNDLKNNIYDEIISDIRFALFKKYKSDKEIRLEDFESEE